MAIAQGSFARGSRERLAEPTGKALDFSVFIEVATPNLPLILPGA